MLRQCSLRRRFPVCSSGGNSNRKSSFWRLVGICVFPCRTGTSRSCSPSEVCTPITSRYGVGSSGMPQKWNDVCALGSDRPTTVGEWTKPTSGSRASDSNLASERSIRWPHHADDGSSLLQHGERGGGGWSSQGVEDDIITGR